MILKVLRTTGPATVPVTPPPLLYVPFKTSVKDATLFPSNVAPTLMVSRPTWRTVPMVLRPFDEAPPCRLLTTIVDECEVLAKQRITDDLNLLITYCPICNGPITITLPGRNLTQPNLLKVVVHRLRPLLSSPKLRCLTLQDRWVTLQLFTGKPSYLVKVPMT